MVHVSAETLAGEAGAGTADDWRAGVRHGHLTAGGTALGRGESRIEGGPHVSAETSRRLACDAGVVTMTHDRGGNVGGRHARRSTGRSTRWWGLALC